MKREELKSAAVTRLELAETDAKTERVKREPSIEQMERLIKSLKELDVPAEVIGEMLAPAFAQDPELSLMLRGLMRGPRGSSG
jgi:hypothetical protein